MTTKDKAAGAAPTIDAPQFYGRLIACILAPVEEREAEIKGLVAYIDAHVAQRCDAVRDDQMAIFKKSVSADQAEFNRKWTEQKERAEAAEASLARLVEGVRKAPSITWWNSRDGHQVFNNMNGDDLVLRKDLLSLLPAKAEAPDWKAVKQLESAEDVAAFKDKLDSMTVYGQDSAPAPAMGEELPPLTWEKRVADALPGMDLRWLQPAYQIEKMAEELAEYRARMALRQPGVDPDDHVLSREDLAAYRELVFAEGVSVGKAQSQPAATAPVSQPAASGTSPCIEDRDGLPAAMRAVIESRGSYQALRSLYRLINIWGAEQRATATICESSPQPVQAEPFYCEQCMPAILAAAKKGGAA